MLLSHFCTRSRTGHVYHNNKQQQSTKTDLDTSGDLLKTHFRNKWQVGLRTFNFEPNFVFYRPVVVTKRVSMISIYLLSTHSAHSLPLWIQLRHGISREWKIKKWLKDESLYGTHCWVGTLVTLNIVSQQIVCWQLPWQNTALFWVKI